MTPVQWLLLPVFGHVALTTVVLLTLAWRRRIAFKAGGVDRRALIDDRQWPDAVLKVSNNYKSQFEWPVMFHAACLLALQIGNPGTAFTALAWGFLAARIWHTVNHITVNRLPGRFLAFLQEGQLNIKNPGGQ